MSIYAAIIISLLIGFGIIYSIGKGDGLLDFIDYFLLGIMAICISGICFFAIAGIVVAIDLCKNPKIPEEKFVQFEYKNFWTTGLQLPSHYLSDDGWLVHIGDPVCLDSWTSKEAKLKWLKEEYSKQYIYIEPQSNKE